MKNSHDCDLKSCLLCQLCLKDWLPAVATHRESIFVKKGQDIFREGDPVKGIYFIYSGNVKVHKKWSEEKDLIIRFAKKGEILGHTGLGEDAHYPVSATALEPVVVCHIGMDFFESTLRVNSELTYRLMRFMAGELQEAEKRVRNLVHMPVKGRIAQALLNLKTQFGLSANGSLGIEITRQDLASFAGASYETLFKVINEFTEEKLIEASGKSITIVNETMLRELTLKTS